MKQTKQGLPEQDHTSQHDKIENITTDATKITLHNQNFDKTQKPITNPALTKKGRIKKSAAEKFARFFLVLAIFALVLSALPYMGVVASFLYMAILALILIASFLTLLANEGFMAHLNSQTAIAEFLASLIKFSPFMLFLAAFLMSISTLFSFANKRNRKNKVAIVVKIILTMICIMIALSLQFK